MMLTTLQSVLFNYGWRSFKKKKKGLLILFCIYLLNQFYDMSTAVTEMTKYPTAATAFRYTPLTGYELNNQRFI